MDRFQLLNRWGWGGSAGWLSAMVPVLLVSISALAASPGPGSLPPAAADALAVGDCTRAVGAIGTVEIASLGTPMADAARLALARCASRLGRGNDALALLEAPLDPAFAGYAGLVGGGALLVAGRPSEAAERLAGLSLSGDAAARATLLRGKALIEAGSYVEGRDALRTLLSGPAGDAGVVAEAGGVDPAEVRWWLAEGALRRGEPDKAVPVWQAIWSKNPTSPWAAEAEARLRAAGAPPEAAAPGGEDLVADRVRTLEKLRMYPEALALRDTMGGAEQGSARTQARAAFRGKAYGRAVEAFARIPDPTPEERFDHALAMSRTGDYAAAADLYRALIAAAPNHPKADFASFKIGYLAYDAGDLDRAVPLLRAHLAAYPTSSHADEARWFIGWSLYRQGRPDDADAAFADLLKASGGTDLAPAAAYWRARIRADRGDDAGARSGYEAVLQRWPTTGYAWFAAWRLGRHWDPVPIALPPAPPAGVDGEPFRRGVALAAVGLHTWAQAELVPLVPAAKRAGRDGALSLAHALVSAGAFTTAQALARPYCGKPWAGGDPVAQQACWPRPSGAMVARLAAAGGLDANLPFAIMNAESALKPEVTSPAGARGLMQLMPDLAAGLHAARFPGQPYLPDDLYQPAYNAALGVAELTALHGRFGASGVEPDLPLIIAGYNGGPDAVQRWLSATDVPPQPDRFAEDIGYTETRQYVRRVLGYLQTLRYVYGDG